MARFQATLFKVPGKGGWTFAPVPLELTPEVSGPWGMSPVIARLAGREWATSIWKDRTHGLLLPIPAKVRGALGDGDVVEIELEADARREPARRPGPAREA